jgi:prevent-host-death family protein
MNVEFNVHEAKTQFSKLLKRVEAGEEITISRAGVPVAKLIPVVAQPGRRPLGFLQGQVWMADDFDAPLPDDLLALFEGEEPKGEETKRKKPSQVKAGKSEKKRAKR